MAVQTSKWEVLQQTAPTAPNFVGYDTNGASNATLRVRKVDQDVELWPSLECTKTIDLPTADYEAEITLAGNDTFSAGCTNEANWTYGAGSTGLTIASIAKDSDTQVTVTFDPQIELGQLDISKASALKLAQLAITKSTASEIGQMAITEDSASKLGQIAVARKSATSQTVLTLSGCTALELNPVFTVDLTHGTFLSEAAAETTANWTFNWGTSNLTLGAVAWVSGTQATVTAVGTAAAGSTVTFKVESPALSSARDSAVATYVVDTETSTSAPLYYDPVYTATLSETTFISLATVENLTNWTYTAEDSGLTLDSITYVDATHAELVMDGTENRTDGNFKIQALAANQTNTVDSGVCSYNCATDGTSCTDTLYGLNPVYAVALTEDTFKSEATCENVSNWTFDMTGSGLSIVSVTYVGAGACTIETAGIALNGTFTAMYKAAASTAGYDSGVATYTIATDASTATVSPYGVNPVYAVVLSEDTFQSEATCNDTANWTFVAGTTGLALGTVTWANNTHCTMNCTGLAATGTFTAMVENAALTRNYDSGVCSYVVATDISNCSDAAYGVDPVYAVVLTDDTFTSEANCNNAANWTFAWGTSGLTLTSITWSDANNCTVQTAGIALASTFTAKCNIALMTQALASGVATYTVATDASTCTDAPRLVAGTITLMAEKAALTVGTYDSGVATIDLSDGATTTTTSEPILVKVGITSGSVAPTMRVVINTDAFIDHEAAETLANWTIGVGTTALTVSAITWINERTADVKFLGTAAGGDITIAIDSTVLIGGTTGVSTTYAVDAAAWSGTYTQSAMAGAVDVWQWPAGSSVQGYIGQYTPAPYSGYNIADVNLMISDNYNPRHNTAVMYTKHGGETVPFIAYGQLILS